MKKLLLIAVLVLCLTALVSVGVTGGGGNTAGPAPDAQTFQHLMVPGDAIVYPDGYSDLGAHYWEGDLDVHIIVNVSPSGGKLSMNIWDCCILADSMLALQVTPEGIVGGGGHGPGGSMHIGPIPVPAYSWAIGIAGYWWCPGGFPAGYYYDIYMKAP
jgi:hypothetical protein